MSKPTAQSTIEIHAPIDLVWRVMLETSAYPAWNPFVVKVGGVVGAPTVGQAMLLEVRWSDGSLTRSKEVFARIEGPSPAAEGAPRSALLVYTFAGLLSTVGAVRGDRLQALSQQPGGPTIYRTTEEFSGFLRAFVPLARVQDGFDRHARALKARAEALAHEFGATSSG